MATIALLPLKANSERVVGKNYRDFCGKPLFHWVLDTLLSIEAIDCVVINTDAPDLCLRTGLEQSERLVLRKRKPELCGDEVSMNKIIADDIDNVPADVYLMTHATNPLISHRTIVEALSTFELGKKKGVLDSLFTVNKVQTRFYKGDGTPVNHDPDNLIPTQDIEPWYEENSNLYIFTHDSFLSSSSRIGLRPELYATPALESVDIDTPEDWEFAEAAHSYLSTLECR